MLQQFFSCGAKLRENLVQRPGIVICFFCFSIVKVCCGELVAGLDVIVHSAEPERLEIEQMPGVFLSRPFFFGLSKQAFRRTSAQCFFEPGGSAAQTRTEIRKHFDRKRELKLAFKPNRCLTHGSTQEIRFT